ncbi:hypothetical protein HNP46_000023 [Pseudomonas nitritireducens]|uniref:ART-PolyVal-like domain-containing protein n=1 Tax=Pseudomonas nitroreducens TaxID=46680 RepID=A0A7W7KE79_PSENT|nr:hypothetical protein [Pseudomonas nitritireducens]MBB4861212.1 hypothetical protein [Pseudomonas nitritireducens]
MTRKPILIQDLNLYHGSPCRIEQFSYDYNKDSAASLGHGFYFTNKLNVAKGYTERHHSNHDLQFANETPTIHKVRVTLNNPMDSKHKQALSRAVVRSLITCSPCLDTALANNFDVDFQGKKECIEEACGWYCDYYDRPLAETLSSLSTDFWQDHNEAFSRLVYELLRYDGVVAYDEKGGVRGDIIVSAWFPEQIEILAYLDPKLERDSSFEP